MSINVLSFQNYHHFQQTTAFIGHLSTSGFARFYQFLASTRLLTVRFGPRPVCDSCPRKSTALRLSMACRPPTSYYVRLQQMGSLGILGSGLSEWLVWGKPLHCQKNTAAPAKECCVSEGWKSKVGFVPQSRPQLLVPRKSSLGSSYRTWLCSDT